MPIWNDPPSRNEVRDDKATFLITQPALRDTSLLPSSARFFAPKNLASRASFKVPPSPRRRAMTSEHYASPADDAKTIAASCQKSTRIPIRRLPFRYDRHSPDSLRGRRVFTTSNDGKKHHVTQQRVTFPRHMNLKCAGTYPRTFRRRTKAKTCQNPGPSSRCWLQHQ